MSYVLLVNESEIEMIYAGLSLLKTGTESFKFNHFHTNKTHRKINRILNEINKFKTDVSKLRDSL